MAASRRCACSKLRRWRGWRASGAGPAALAEAAGIFVAGDALLGKGRVGRAIATNLVPNDTNGAMDIFVFNRATQAIQRVSVSSAGQQSSFNNGGGNNAESSSPSISSDGRFVAFQSRADNLVPGDTNGGNNAPQGQDVFVFDRNNNSAITEPRRQKISRASVPQPCRRKAARGRAALRKQATPAKCIWRS